MKIKILLFCLRMSSHQVIRLRFLRLGHPGANIPVSLQNIFYENVNIKLRKGENKKIKLLLDGVEYPALLTNIYFDETKYPTHKELLQIRWTPKSEVAQRLREIFNCSYSYLFTEKEKLTNRKKQLSVPEELREYLAIYSTAFDDVFAIECITHSEIIEAKQEIRQFNELELEQILQATDTALVVGRFFFRLFNYLIIN